MDALSRSFIRLAEEKLVPICRAFSVPWSTGNKTQQFYLEFEVSDGFLIKSYPPSPTRITEPGEPADTARSESSVEKEGDTSDITPGEEESPPPVPSAIYLVEPYRRNQAVMRFSGTLGVNRTGDQRSTTMAAFAHYMAQETGCTCIFADIQGA